MTMTTTSRLIGAAWRMSLLSLIALCAFALAAHGQSFSSGSDGSDGAFDLTGTASGSTVTFVPANFPGDQHNLNKFNFTSVVVPAGVTVRLSAKNINGPVYWLVSGDVDVEGTIDLSGQAGLPASQILDGRRRQLDAGVGGYSGGTGGNANAPLSPSQPVAQNGDGPGGGAAGSVCNPTSSGTYPPSGGTFSGDSFLVPLIGGSGGGGGLFFGNPSPYGASGGAGGGALFIASSTTITVNGTINANGGIGGNGGTTPTTTNSGCLGSYYAEGWGGGGSGGGIRLVANTIAGSGTVTALGGSTATVIFPLNPQVFPQTNGGNGVVRIEAFTDSFTGTISGVQSTGTPNSAFLLLPSTPPPSVNVVSVNSAPIPASPTASLTTPDATINTSSPVTITVQASYIPVGTVLTLQVFSDNNTDQTVQTTALAGTLQSSTATATVTFPSGYALNYVKATWSMTN